jgi:hypothetical protein
VSERREAETHCVDASKAGDVHMMILHASHGGAKPPSRDFPTEAEVLAAMGQAPLFVLDHNSTGVTINGTHYRLSIANNPKPPEEGNKNLYWQYCGQSGFDGFVVEGPKQRNAGHVVLSAPEIFFGTAD